MSFTLNFKYEEWQDFLLIYKSRWKLNWLKSWKSGIVCGQLNFIIYYLKYQEIGLVIVHFLPEDFLLVHSETVWKDSTKKIEWLNEKWTNQQKSILSIEKERKDPPAAA